MQDSRPHRRHPIPAFVNHTPRFERLEPSSAQPEMTGPIDMALGAGRLYTNAIMGQVPSAIERENARKASSTILREDSIHVEESENVSRPDSWSMHYDCTDQAPYSDRQDDETMTQASLLHIPSENPSHELAFFLRTTGPTAPHRRPSKIEDSPRPTRGPRNAFRFLRAKQRQAAIRSATAHDRYVCIAMLRPHSTNVGNVNSPLRDEGGLLSDIAEHPGSRGVPVQQKVSSTGILHAHSMMVFALTAGLGKRYPALQVPTSDNIETGSTSASTFM